MDKSQHSKLSRAFEQAAEREAQANPLPEQLWQHIAQDLSANTPVESGERIQQAFEEQAATALPPANLWDNIAKDLGNNKIKESFETQDNLVVPTAIWNDIEEQLEIESVWKKVAQVLDRRTSWLYWREKMVQGSLLLLILLWLRGCEWETQPIDPIVTDPVAATSANPKGASITHSKTQQIRSTASEQMPISTTSKASKEQNGLETRATNTPKKTVINEQELQAYIVQNATSAITTPIQKELPNTSISRPASANLGNPPTILNQNKETTPAKTPATLKGNSSQTGEATPSIIPIEPKPFATPNTNEKTLSTKEAVAPHSPRKAPTTTAIITDANNNAASWLPAAPKPTEALSTLTTDNITNPLVWTLEAIELQKVQPMRPKQQSHIEFGMEARVRGTVLLGNMTTEAMESTSMMKTKLMPTVAVGVNLAWYFTRNDALVVALHPLAASRQYFGGYTEKGRYYHKEIKLSYFDIEAAYQRTLLHYNDFGALPSTVYARVSYGFGYLNKGETVLNGMATDETTLYNNTNHNFGLSLGNTHRLRRWVVDYGIYGQLGVSTIHLQQPANYSHLLGVGAYLGLRYSL